MRTDPRNKVPRAQSQPKYIGAATAYLNLLFSRSALFRRCHHHINSNPDIHLRLHSPHPPRPNDPYASPKERKMTLKQYTHNLRNICKDGTSPDSRLLAGYYERVSRYEWQVEERKYMQRAREVPSIDLFSHARRAEPLAS